MVDLIQILANKVLLISLYKTVTGIPTTDANNPCVRFHAHNASRKDTTRNAVPRCRVRRFNIDTMMLNVDVGNFHAQNPYVSALEQ